MRLSIKAVHGRYWDYEICSLQNAGVLFHIESGEVCVKQATLERHQSVNDSPEDVIRGRGYTLLCGVDEAGRGPIAGPVVAAALILPENAHLRGVDDSKKLSPTQRDKVFTHIAELELPFGIGILDSEEIDRINILKASLLAMRKAVTALKEKPEVLLVDGLFTIPNVSLPQYAIVGGDSRCKCIGAASILAKVTRDRIMDHYHRLYPHYGFNVHKGYPTVAHLAALRKFGPSPIHRQTFRPVAELAQHVLV